MALLDKRGRSWRKWWWLFIRQLEKEIAYSTDFHVGCQTSGSFGSQVYGIQ
jgi:hypothetical protein